MEGKKWITKDLLSSKYMPMAKLYGIRMTQAIIYLMLHFRHLYVRFKSRKL